MEKRTAMRKDFKAEYDAFRKECGDEIMFRFALGYLMDKGFDYTLSITEEDIKEMVSNLQKEDKKRTNSFSLMTPEFQGDIVRRAVKLAKIGDWCGLLKYVTNEVFINF